MLLIISLSIFFPIRFSIFSKRTIICLSSILVGYTSMMSLDIIASLHTSLISIQAFFRAKTVMLGSTPLSNLYDASVLRL